MYRIMVKIFDEVNKKYEWRALRPSGCKTPYQYETKAEAIKIKNICYPGELAEGVKIEAMQ